MDLAVSCGSLPTSQFIPRALAVPPAEGNYGKEYRTLVAKLAPKEAEAMEDLLGNMILKIELAKRLDGSGMRTVLADMEVGSAVELLGLLRGRRGFTAARLGAA